jgi:hypothetical protein
MPALVGPPRLRFLLMSMLLALSGALGGATSAGAEEVFTGQAAAARATESTWIPAPQRRAAVCIVDTGAGNAGNANPDLANVVARFAVDNGLPDDLSDDHHGTRMSMIASAPLNAFGMVGASPSIDVVSVRASRDGATFGSADLTTAIQMCSNKHTTYNIKVISLSLGGPINTGLDLASMGAMQNAVDNARRVGIAVVAAAGNHPGSVDWPAGYAPVLAVGAADNEGAMCPFAASGPEVDLWALGCPQDIALPDGRPAWASGSSEATAFVAGVLAQLRGLNSELGVEEAQQLLTFRARTTPSGPSLDVDAAFRAAGLSAQLATGRAAIPPATAPSPPEDQPNATTTTPPATVSAQTMPPAATDVPSARPGLALRPIAALRSRLRTPAVRSIRVRRGKLTIIFKAKPKKIQARIDIFSRTRARTFPTRTRRLLTTSDHLRTRVSGTLSEVSITYRDPTHARTASATLTLHPRS